MFQRLSTVPWLSRLLLAGGLLGLLVMMAEPGQVRAAAKLAIAVAASEAADNEAVDKANKYFVDLKEDKNKEQKAKEGKRAKDGLPPDFPNPPTEPTGPTPADVAAAATLLPTGIGEQLVAGLELNRSKPKPAPPSYRWVALSGDRELRILGLREKASVKKYWEEAKAAREKGRVYIHSRFGIPIYSRPAPKGGSVDFFLLVLDPGGDKVITEEQVVSVRKLDTEVGIVLFFSDPEGKDRLQAFTAALKPDPENKSPRYMVLSSDDEVVEIARVTDVISSGRMKLGAGLGPAELDRLYRQLTDLLARKSSATP